MASRVIKMTAKKSLKFEEGFPKFVSITVPGVSEFVESVVVVEVGVGVGAVVMHGNIMLSVGVPCAFVG